MATSAAADSNTCLLVAELFFETAKLFGGICDLRFRSGRTRHQFRATLLVRAPALGGAVHFQREVVQFIAVLLAFGVDGVTALHALAVFAVHCRDSFSAGVNVFADGREFRFEPGNTRNG